MMEHHTLQHTSGERDQFNAASKECLHADIVAPVNALQNTSSSTLSSNNSIFNAISTNNVDVAAYEVVAIFSHSM